MKRYKMRVCSLYLSVLFILALFGSFLTGCGHVELLEYGDEETYAKSDADFMAAPSPSDIFRALGILTVPGQLTTVRSDEDAVLWAISIVLNTMNLEVAEISNVNMTFSIDEFVESVDQTLRLSGRTISTSTLKSIVIQTLNASIIEARDHQNERLDPNKTAFFALGERLVVNGITQITDNMTSQKILDTASFVILSAVINQAISASINEAIAEEILNNPNILDEYRDRLIPQGIPLAENSLSYYAKKQLQSNPEFSSVERKVKDDVSAILQQNLSVQGVIVPGEIAKPNVLNAIQNATRNVSLNVISMTERESQYLDLTTRLTVVLSHQGIVSVGWSS